MPVPQTASFAVKLEDQTSGPATSAATALERLKSRIDADTKALGEMNKALRNLKGGTSTSSRTFAELRDRIAAQRASIAQAQSAYLQLGGTFGTVAGAGDGAGGAFGRLVQAAKRLPGPLGGIVGRLGEMGALVGGGGLIAAGVLAIAAAFLAVAAAAATAAAAVLRYGIATADARRTELLHLEGLTSIRNMYGIAAGSATELQSAIDRVSDSTATGRSDVARYAEQLYRMGLRGEALSQALEGVSIVSSVQGERMAQRFAGMAAGAVRTGRSVRALADDVRARLGGIARRQMLSLEQQSRRLHEGFARLFSGLRIEGFLAGLNEITSLFSQSTASGRALKAIIEAIFNPLLDWLGRGGPLARRFFQGMVIAALQLTIVVLRLRNMLRDAFGGRDVLGGVDALTLALYGGMAVIGLIAGAATVAALAFGAMGLAIASVVGPIMALQRIGERAGRALAEGVVAGIQSGRALVEGTIGGLASDATRALRNALGIRSPSRVFAQLGAQIPLGLAAGVEQSAGAASDAVDEMAPAPLGGARGGNVSSSIGPFEITIHTAATDGRAIAGELRDALAHVLEGVTVQVGGQPA